MVVTETVETAAMPIVGSDEGAPAALVLDDQPGPVVTSVQERTSQVSQAALKMKREIGRRADAPTIVVPVLRMTAVQSSFSLADITETDSFRKLGVALAANPDGELSRTLVGARVVVGPDGIKRTELVRSEAADHIRSTPSLFSLADLRDNLTEMVAGLACGSCSQGPEGRPAAVSRRLLRGTRGQGRGSALCEPRTGRRSTGTARRRGATSLHGEAIV